MSRHSCGRTRKFLSLPSLNILFKSIEDPDSFSWDRTTLKVLHGTEKLNKHHFKQASTSLSTGFPVDSSVFTSEVKKRKSCFFLYMTWILQSWTKIRGVVQCSTESNVPGTENPKVGMSLVSSRNSKTSVAKEDWAGQEWQTRGGKWRGARTWGFLGASIRSLDLFWMCEKSQ